MNTAVIGLGAMGSALASTLLEKEIKLRVWNRSPEKAAALVHKGAVHAASIEDAVNASELLIVCLLNYDTVYEALRPAAPLLKGKVLMNLTNGTPQQARDMALWAEEHGATYIDGGILAVPPMIGGPDALIIYSGAKEPFDKYKQHLDVWGKSQFVGEDAGLAALHDISLLIGMYGLFGGALQALALITSADVSASKFMQLLKPWLMAMMSQVEIMASEIDSKNYSTYVESTLGMQAAAYVNMIKASEEAGLSTALVTPLDDVMQRAVKAGFGSSNISSMVEVIRNGF